MRAQKKQRTLLIAANWKMYAAPLHIAAGKSQIPNTKSHVKVYQPRENVDVVVFPTFLDITTCIEAGLTVGGQWGHPEDTGAFTGDISMKMLRDLGCTYVLCGHSERRRNHGESNEFVAAQVVSALTHGLHPILCIGETWEERKAGRSKEVVQTQLEAVLARLETSDMRHEKQGNSKLTSLLEPVSTPSARRRGEPRSRGQVSHLALAYEPVWAISGGDPNKPAATASDAQEMHAYIRKLLPTPYSLLPIIYGGSMKPENAEELLAQPDIDGGLVGNASLDPKKFAEIVEIAEQA